MRCPNCGWRNPDGSKICEKCEIELERTKTVSAASTIMGALQNATIKTTASRTTIDPFRRTNYVSGEQQPFSLSPGEEIGRYIARRKIGEGTMASIYQVGDTIDNRV